MIIAPALEPATLQSMFILRVPMGANARHDVQDADAAARKRKQAAFDRHRLQSPEDRLPGTHAQAGYQLVLVMGAGTAAEVGDTFSGDIVTGYDEAGDPIVENLGLDWQIVAQEGVAIDQAALLPYFDADPVLDENGDVIGDQPVTDLTGRLQVWAGRQWTF